MKFRRSIAAAITGVAFLATPVLASAHNTQSDANFPNSMGTKYVAARTSSGLITGSATVDARWRWDSGSTKTQGFKAIQVVDNIADGSNYCVEAGVEFQRKNTGVPYRRESVFRSCNLGGSVKSHALTDLHPAAADAYTSYSLWVCQSYRQPNGQWQLYNCGWSGSFQPQSIIFAGPLTDSTKATFTFFHYNF